LGGNAPKQECQRVERGGKGGGRHLLNDVNGVMTPRNKVGRGKLKMRGKEEARATLLQKPSHGRPLT